ncbi:hypothetical protein BV133_3092 [Blastochloris viridis]|nr:hypothetical protein BV133_3092 [Blastochloris viridis]
MAALVGSVLVQPAEAWRGHKDTARVAPEAIDDGPYAFDAAACDPDGFVGGPVVPGYYGGPVYYGGPAVSYPPPPRRWRTAPVEQSNDVYFRRWYETR